MSEATSDDIVNIALILANDKGRLNIHMLAMQMGNMKALDFGELLREAVNDGRLSFVTDDTIEVPKNADG